MRGTIWMRALVLLGALMLVASACGSDDKGSDASSDTTAKSGEPEADFESMLWDNGPCDTALDPYPLGIIAPVDSAVVSLRPQVVGAQASVEAFNARGGIGGHCMELTACDPGPDPNKEVDCARQMVDDGIVATIDDTTVSNPAGVQAVMEAAKLPRVGISPSNTEMGSPVSYALGLGGAGSMFMQVPPLAREGIKKIAVIRIDTAPAGMLVGVLGQGMLAAYGGEFVVDLPVPAGTTDFQQFILAAEDAGAEGAIVPLGQAESLQVLQAAQQLGTDMKFSVSMGSWGREDVAAFGDFAKQIVFNGDMPPATASVETWPILKDVIHDLEASGDPDNQLDAIKNGAIRSWAGVYSLVRAVEDHGNPDDISREGITAAFEAVKDLDMFGLVPPWTPSAGSGEGLFGSISQPWYYIADWDADAENFVVRPEMINALLEFEGKIDYEPRPATGA
jgi:ABC-type branched-subunit amino acid transport system substrate-binding protein